MCPRGQGGPRGLHLCLLDCCSKSDFQIIFSNFFELFVLLFEAFKSANCERTSNNNTYYSYAGLCSLCLTFIKLCSFVLLVCQYLYNS